MSDEYIKRENAIMRAIKYVKDDDLADAIVAELKKIPSADVVERTAIAESMVYADALKDAYQRGKASVEHKRGEWIIKTDEKFDIDYYVCSSCGYEPYRKIDISNFCPNCGADMRKERVSDGTDTD